MDAYEAFKKQLLENKLAELKTREKKEFFAKVANAAYEDEMQKLSSMSPEQVTDWVKTTETRGG
jgi:NADH:ubiquinone oxidoreductase subunit F (NADH-binding)